MTTHMLDVAIGELIMVWTSNCSQHPLLIHLMHIHDNSHAGCCYWRMDHGLDK